MLENVIKEAAEEVSEGIYSCLPASERHSPYDSKVGAYDALVGNRFYNRLVWGNWPANYAAFCRQALEPARGELFLDAGCGSLVFTAAEYARAHDSGVVLLDRSLGMLARGRQRIKKLLGHVPNNIVFIQGDIFHLPFVDGAFASVGCFGLLHMFEEKLALLAELERVRRPQGQLLATSLVGNNALGRRYLEALKNAGEVARCETSESLAEILGQSPSRYEIRTTGNMAYVRGRQQLQ